MENNETGCALIDYMLLIIACVILYLIWNTVWTS
jgi:hypothetical protein